MKYANIIIAVSVLMIVSSGVGYLYTHEISWLALFALGTMLTVLCNMEW